MPKSEGLTPKQEQFCREYIKDFNATAAAKRAGFSASTANSYAAKLLSSAVVSARVRELARRVAKKAELDAEHALRRALETLDLNIYDLVTIDKSGRMSLKPNDDIHPRKQRQVLELRFSESDGETGSSTVCQIRVKDNTQLMKLAFQYLRLVGDDRDPNDDGKKQVDAEVHARITSVLERIERRQTSV